MGARPAPLAGETESIAEVVGVVGNVVYWPFDEPPGPDVYQPALQFSYPWTTVMARVTGEPSSHVEAMRRAVAGIDPTLPIADVTTLEADDPEHRHDLFVDRWTCAVWTTAWYRNDLDNNRVAAGSYELGALSRATNVGGGWRTVAFDVA